MITDEAATLKIAFIEMGQAGEDDTAGRHEGKCNLKPTQYSSARCELDPGHAPEADGTVLHVGRTVGGYWKFWYTKPEEPRDP